MKRLRPPPSFGRALRFVRTALGYPQEAFAPISGRTYVSALERGAKHPTLPKVDQLATVLGVHPLALLTLAYCEAESVPEIERLLDQARSQALAILAASDCQR